MGINTVIGTVGSVGVVVGAVGSVGVVVGAVGSVGVVVGAVGSVGVVVGAVGSVGVVVGSSPVSGDVNPERVSPRSVVGEGVVVVVGSLADVNVGVGEV